MITAYRNDETPVCNGASEVGGFGADRAVFFLSNMQEHCVSFALRRKKQFMLQEAKAGPAKKGGKGLHDA